MSGTTGWFVGTEACDVAVIVVTYNNADDIDAMIASLRPEASDLRLRLIVVDNSSIDETVAVAERHRDVLTVRAGGNLGYAGGINVGRALVGPGEDVLVLNPDLRVHRGAVVRLWKALHSSDDIGITAPRILDDHGRTFDSLHNEPTVLRGWVDAVLGPVWRRRPVLLTEWVRDEASYTAPRDVDWASGAALMIRACTDATVGAWDEQFFLYSEETDYCRRTRDAGYRVHFVPAATVRHSQGGSGTSVSLDALLNVNRVKYVRKHSPAAAGAYRLAVLAGAVARGSRSAGHRASAAHLCREKSWTALPQATHDTAVPSIARGRDEVSE
jgi:GT2 family glycosyltransferase